MITLDTSGLLARINQADRHHTACKTVLDADPGPYIIPVAVLAEITFLMEQRLRPQFEQAFLEDLSDGAYVPDWDAKDVDRIRQLVDRYSDLPLGFADAAVVAGAERHAGRVLTTDRRHFPLVARGEKTITPLPPLGAE